MRDITQLHPNAQALAKKLITECQAAGLIIKISECLRTVEEQNKLYAQGRTISGSIVTNANGTDYNSMHQWGVAFDIYRADGKGAYYNSDNFFSKVGNIGEKIGLEWGGNWESFKDLPHFQLKQWGSTPKKLKQLYGTPEEFIKTWGNAKSNYYSKYNGSSNSLVDALNSLNINSSAAHREAIAAANGIKNYAKTAAQNKTLLDLLKQGKLLIEN